MSGSQSRQNLQGPCPSTEECGRARLVPRPSSHPGGAGPRTREGDHRAECVASTPASESPWGTASCLNVNTFILNANEQRTVFLRLSQSCRLSLLAALPFHSRLCPFLLLVEAEPLFLSSFLKRGAEGVLDSIYKPSDKIGLGTGFIRCVSFANPSHPHSGAPLTARPVPRVPAHEDKFTRQP